MVNKIILRISIGSFYFLQNKVPNEKTLTSYLKKNEKHVNKKNFNIIFIIFVWLKFADFIAHFGCFIFLKYATQIQKHKNMKYKIKWQ